MRHCWRRSAESARVCFNPRFGGVGNATDDLLRKCTILLRRFQSPIWWGWECDNLFTKGLRHANAGFNPRFGGVGNATKRIGRPPITPGDVSIPDLVGLGMRPQEVRFLRRHLKGGFNPRFGGVGNATQFDGDGDVPF